MVAQDFTSQDLADRRFGSAACRPKRTEVVLAQQGISASLHGLDIQGIVGVPAVTPPKRGRVRVVVPGVAVSLLGGVPTRVKNRRHFLAFPGPYRLRQQAVQALEQLSWGLSSLRIKANHL